MGILKDDQRGFPAQLHRHMFDAICRRRIDLAARGHRPGQRHLVHAWVIHQSGPDVPQPLHHVVKPRWQPRLMQDLGHFERTKRRRLGGLEDHRIAASQRRRAFPAGDLGGIVPGPNAHADPQRFAAGVDPVFPIQRNVLARQGRRHATEILQRIRARGGIHG